MLCTEAIKITGGLSAPSKVGAGYSIPASCCITGTRLRKVEGSVCRKCYAHNRNRYAFPSVKAAMDYRYHALSNPAWVAAMVRQIKGKAYFRWHDSGDLQSVQHLKNIVEVCRQTPETKHWLPTKEWGGLEKGKWAKKIVERWQEKGGKIPPNLVIRKAMYFLDQDPPDDLPGAYCAVATQRSRVTCPSTLKKGTNCEQNNCRKCWNPKVRLVRYREH